MTIRKLSFRHDKTNTQELTEIATTQIRAALNISWHTEFLFINQICDFGILTITFLSLIHF